LDMLDVPIFDPDHPPDLLGGPAAAFTQRAQLAADHLGAAVFAVALLEKPGKPPVLSRRERGGARGDHLNAFGRLAATRAQTVRQTRSEMEAVAAMQFFVQHSGRRLDRELDRALQDEGELVFVVVAEAVAAG